VPELPAELAALRAGLDELQRETGWSITVTDEFTSELLTLVAALEEIMFATWPRSVLLRIRWRRDVRASIAHIDGEGFRERRGNTITSGWVTRP
jgi:uncharacterized membrane protein